MRPTMTARPGQRGFTLSETLTALAVAGIGLSLATPSLQSLAARNEHAAAVNQLVSTLHRARSESVMRNTPVAVCASVGGERCDGEAWRDGWIAFVDADADQQRAAGETLLERVPALAGLELESPQFDTVFSYRPNGRLGNDSAGSAAQFVFCRSGATTPERVVFVRTSGIPALVEQPRAGSAAGCGAG